MLLLAGALAVCCLCERALSRLAASLRYWSTPLDAAEQGYGRDAQHAREHAEGV